MHGEQGPPPSPPSAPGPPLRCPCATCDTASAGVVKSVAATARPRPPGKSTSTCAGSAGGVVYQVNPGVRTRSARCSPPLRHCAAPSAARPARPAWKPISTRPLDGPRDCARRPLDADTGTTTDAPDRPPERRGHPLAPTREHPMGSTGGGARPGPPASLSALAPDGPDDTASSPPPPVVSAPALASRQRPRRWSSGRRGGAWAPAVEAQRPGGEGQVSGWASVEAGVLRASRSR